MAEEPRAMKPRPATELRAEFDATRARIDAQLDEIESRLRTEVQRVIAADGDQPGPDARRPLDALRLVSGLKGSAAAALVVGAVAGYVAVRRLAMRRPGGSEGGTS